MNKSYNIGGFLNFELPPQDLLDMTTEIFDKLTKVGNRYTHYTLSNLRLDIECDQISSWVRVSMPTQFSDLLLIRVSEHSAKFSVQIGEHWIVVEDDSWHFQSRWRKNLRKIAMNNLEEASNAGTEEGMAVIREFLTSFIAKINNEGIQPKPNK